MKRECPKLCTSDHDAKETLKGSGMMEVTAGPTQIGDEYEQGAKEM